MSKQRKSRSPYVKFVCVLKTGGDYTPKYVFALRNALRRHVSNWVDNRFICLTDCDSIPSTICTSPLRSNLPGWWSKLEAFKIQGPVIYLDLDTVVVGSIDPLMRKTADLVNEFIMLKAFNRKEQWASGIMGWKSNQSWLHTNFKRSMMDTYKWDQRYIKRSILARGTSIVSVQDHLEGVYSYKHHCQVKLPNDARIVCFHGQPRPIDVNHDWRKKAWEV